MRRLLPVFLLFTLPALASPIQSLYHSLDPDSLSQHMAFYELYPETHEGKKALKRAWELLSGSEKDNLPSLILPEIDIQSIVSLITRDRSDEPVTLSTDQLEVIEMLSSDFANRHLKGAQVWTRKEVLALPPEQVDLSRGLLIEQFDEDEEKIRQYEASLDVMALQIAARLKKGASDREKIKEINRFIFQEMQFRFPPHSLYAKDIDLYTFLPSVLDSRQGVCLGVSILYLCLAQRLDLPLEIITPPGHIYVRYRDGEEIVNIETTARGINPPSETYLGLNTRSLQQRNIKEVIGMAFFNQASTYWMRGEYEKTCMLYEKSLPYTPGDKLTEMFLGMNYLFVGKIKEGKKLLKAQYDFVPDYAVAQETMVADYLDGKVDVEGLKSLFLPVDQNRESILKKQKELEKIVKKFPKFRGGYMHLAVTHLQLARYGKAREIMEKNYALDPSDPTLAYYLSAVCLERHDYPSAWRYYKQANHITTNRDHNPRALRALKSQLQAVSPL